MFKKSKKTVIIFVKGKDGNPIYAFYSR